MSRRSVLVVVSIVAHLAVGVVLFASGIWELERLESDHRMGAIGVLTPSQATGGSPAALPAPKLEKKQQAEKQIVKNVQWDRRIEKPDAKLAATTSGATGTGTGTGTGIGTGLTGETGDNTTGTLCAVPPCLGTRDVPVPPLPKPPVQKTTLVPPSKMVRIAGDTQIHPARHVRDQILDDRKRRIVGTVKLCIDTRGAVTSAQTYSSTKYPEYDRQLVTAVRGWRYRPFALNGVPTPACSVVSFVYTIK